MPPRFVFNQSTWTAVNLWRMYMRYGTAPLRFQGRPGAMFSRFIRLYDLQACPCRDELAGPPLAFSVGLCSTLPSTCVCFTNCVAHRGPLLQGNGTAFKTPEALLRRVGLFGLTQRSLRQDLAV